MLVVGAFCEANFNLTTVHALMSFTHYIRAYQFSFLEIVLYFLNVFLVPCANWLAVFERAAVRPRFYIGLLCCITSCVRIDQYCNIRQHTIAACACLLSGPDTLRRNNAS